MFELSEDSIMDARDVDEEEDTEETHCDLGDTLSATLTSVPSPPPVPLPTSLILDSLISKYSKSCFKAAHINSQSLRCHIDEIRTIFDSQNFDVIAISESWLKPCIPSTEVDMPGYVLHRNDRINKGGGGVAFYVKGGLKVNILCTSPPEYSARPEFIFAEIRLTGADVLLFCVCYRPPRVGHLADFENTLLRFLPHYGHILVAGDFNTDLLKTSVNYEYVQLTTMISSCNMSFLPFGPTHHTDTTHTLIDLMITSDLSSVVGQGQLPIPGVSHHDLIYCILNIKVPKPKAQYITYRNYKCMDEAAFMYDVYNTQWDNILQLSSVDDMVVTLNEYILNLYNKHAPIVSKRVNKRRPIPWMTDEIRKLMAQRDAIYRRAKRGGEQDVMNQYRFMRNRVKQLLRNSRLRYTHSLFSSKQSSSSLWRNVKILGLGKRVEPVVEVPLDDLNDHFCSQSNTPVSPETKIYMAQLNNEIQINPPSQEFEFQPLTTGDIVRAIRHVTSNALGSDAISMGMIKTILFAIIPCILAIYNKSLQTGTFPSVWKSALIRPLNKIPSPSNLTDYRPISILPALSKGLERIVHCQISEYLARHNLLNPYQSGFRSKHSTETALLRVTDDIRLAIDRGQCTVLTLFDFSKAFDCVQFPLLLTKLRAFGFSNNSLSWMKTYLCGRRQRVCVGDKQSKWNEVTSGVPQGSILGPLLFTLYINNISEILYSVNYHIYADDLQIYIHTLVEDIHNAIKHFNKIITDLVLWSSKHALKLNPLKTQPIVISHPRLANRINVNTIPNISINGTALSYCNKVKNLGITFNCTFSWSDTTTQICRRVFYAMHTLKKLQNFLPRPIKLHLVKSLVFPAFHYCSAVISDMPAVLADKLQRTQNYCMRYVFDIRRDEHITPYYVQSKTLKLNSLNDVKILSILHTILQSKLPHYFSSSFEFVSGRSAICTRSGSVMLRIPHHRTTTYNKSFTVTASRLWNSIPDSLKSIKSRAGFVGALKRIHLQRMADGVLLGGAAARNME